MSFKVPEDLRIRNGRMGTSPEDGRNGAFLLSSASVPGRQLFCIASDGSGWEHVSVSLVGKKARTPTWADMCGVKAKFWGPEDVVIQFHPKKSEYVNNVAGCLHLWRPVGVDLPTPDPGLVGVIGGEL